MALPSYTYSGVCYTATGSETTFALTTSGGESIGYLKKEHIQVETSDDTGNTWKRLSIYADYVFSDPATSVVLNAAPASGTAVRLKRVTPLDDDYIEFEAGSLLTAAQLNTFDTWQLYIDQELKDQINNADGPVPGEAVKSVTGTAPITVDNTNNQTPVVGIDETTSVDDPNSLTSDTKVMSEKAIDEAFKQYVGTGPASTSKTGQFRIDDSSTPLRLFYWNGTAWVQLQTKGDQGDTGPAPGLQDPAATATTIDNKPDGSLGDATALVSQDPATKDIKFSFGVPAGIRGPEGPQSTVPGPPPGLQDPATVVNNVANKGDGSVGDATVAIAQNASGDLQFSFGVPVGEQGIEGPRGPEGPAGSGVSYKGPIDATTASPPSNPASGDFYMNTVSGSTTWPGLGGTVTESERLVWNSDTGQWDGFAPTAAQRIDLSYGAAADKGTILNTGGNDATVPVVTSANAGQMTPAEHNKLVGIQAGAQVNPDLANYIQQGNNVSLLNNDAGYITSADIPATPVTKVNGKTGDVELDLQDITEQGNTTTEDIYIGNGPKIKLKASDGTATFAGRVGIGTDNPGNFSSSTNNLVVSETGGNSGITLHTSSTNSSFLGFTHTGDTNNQGYVGYIHTDDALVFATNRTEHVRINADGSATFGGNVGIGTPSPNKPLHIFSGSSDAEIRLQTNSGTEQNSYITLRQSSGDLDLYTVSSGSNMKFYTVNGERLRIDSSGKATFTGDVQAGGSPAGGTPSTVGTLLDPAGAVIISRASGDVFIGKKQNTGETSSIDADGNASFAGSVQVGGNAPAAGEYGVKLYENGSISVSKAASGSTTVFSATDENADLRAAIYSNGAARFTSTVQVGSGTTGQPNLSISSSGITTTTAGVGPANLVLNNNTTIEHSGNATFAGKVTATTFNLESLPELS